MDEIEIKVRSNTTANLRKSHHKLNHSKSDESRRKSLDRHHRRDFHRDSRHSLNTSIEIESCGPEYDLKCFTPSSNNVKPNTTEDSQVIEIEKPEIHVISILVDDHPNGNALLKVPEVDIDNNNGIELHK